MTSNSLYQINRNLRSKARDALFAYINNISISDMDSLRTQAGLLSILTSQTDEIARNSVVLTNIKTFFYSSSFVFVTVSVSLALS